MLAMAKLVAFAPVSDLTRARHFYEERLGLSLGSADDYGCMYEVNGATLRLSVVQEHTPANYTIVGWTTDDIGATVRELARRGVTFQRYEGLGQDADGIWTAPSGDRVAWFRDPDGNVLSLTQIAS